MEYLALGDGPPTFPQSCLFRGTQEQYEGSGPFMYGAITLYREAFQLLPLGSILFWVRVVSPCIVL